MFTLVGFFENTYNSALNNIAALTDTKYTTSGDDFEVPPNFVNLIAAYVVGATITRARLSSPSMLKRAPMELAPVDATAEPISRPPLINMVANPFKLTAAESLNALTTNSATAGDDQQVFVWLADGKITPVTDKEIFSMRATGTTTATADNWKNATMVLDSDLEPGTYAVVGFRAQGATMIAARLIFTKDDARPGVIGHDAITDVDEDLFRNGRLGIWGEFEHRTPPKVEIFCAAADTAQTYTLDLIKVK